MADCPVDTFYWLQPTDGSCCKETNMQLDQTFEHYAFSFPDPFVIFFHFCQCQVFSSYFTSLHSGLTEYLGVRYCGCFLKKGNVKFCLVCKHESCHLWCRRLMHIDRVSTKRHDMLTMQLCIGRVFWLHRVGNWVNHRFFLRRNVQRAIFWGLWTRSTSLTVSQLGAARKTGSRWQFHHSSLLFASERANSDSCCAGEFWWWPQVKEILSVWNKINKSRYIWPILGDMFWLGL